MARMNGRRMITVTGRPNAASGSATPNGLSRIPNWRSSMYSGSTATVSGSSRPSVKIVYRSSRPRNS